MRSRTEYLVRALSLLALAACNGPSAASSSPQPEPIPECQAYERELARCTGLDAGIATQPRALATNRADRERLQSLCASNLQRLQLSCR